VGRSLALALAVARNPGGGASSPTAV